MVYMTAVKKSWTETFGRTMVQTENKKQSFGTSAQIWLLFRSNAEKMLWRKATGAATSSSWTLILLQLYIIQYISTKYCEMYLWWWVINTFTQVCFIIWIINKVASLFYHLYRTYCKNVPGVLVSSTTGTTMTVSSTMSTTATDDIISSRLGSTPRFFWPRSTRWSSASGSILWGYTINARRSILC